MLIHLPMKSPCAIGAADRIERRADAAAAAMAHDDDVADAHRVDRELDGGRGAVLAAIGLERRHEVGDVAEDEQLARAGIEDGLGRRAAVATGDDHDVGDLPPAANSL